MTTIELRDRLLSFKVFKENEFFNKYLNLITSARGTGTLCQRHHIVPLHVYSILGLDPDNSESNLVTLKYTDHILAHYYLCNFSIDVRVRRANFASLYLIAHNPHVPNNESDLLATLPEYERLYNDYINIQHQLRKGTMTGELNPFYGRSHTDATKQKIRDSLSNMSDERKEYIKQRTREANCGRIKTEAEKQKRIDTMIAHGGCGWWITEEYCKKLSESLKGKNVHSKGRIWVNNGSECKMLEPKNLDMYLNSGWKLGRLPISEATRQAYKQRKKSKPNTGYVWVTNGVDSHTIRPEELDTYIAQGYYRGRTLTRSMQGKK